MSQEQSVDTPQDTMRSPLDPFYRSDRAASIEKGAAAHGKEVEVADHDEPRRKRFLCWFLTKKQWILALVGCVLLVVLVALLIVFLAVVPAIFQSRADKVELSVNYLDLKTLGTDPDSREIDVELSLRVKHDSSISSTMDDAIATLYFEEKPFGAVTLPKQELEKGSHEYDLVITDTAKISDPVVFTALAKTLLQEESVSIDARAEVKVHALGLSYGGLELNRVFTIKALHNFDDPAPSVNNIALKACNPTDYRMVINVTLDNDSQVGLDGVGALNLSVFYQQEFLGYAASVDATAGIPRGASPLEFEVTVAKEASILKIMTQMLLGVVSGNAQFYITGSNELATKAVLLEDAIHALNMSLLYTDGLSKVTLNPECDLLSLISG